jgi:hypothetical protein
MDLYRPAYHIRRGKQVFEGNANGNRNLQRNGYRKRRERDRHECCYNDSLYGGASGIAACGGKRSGVQQPPPAGYEFGQYQ